MILGFISLLLTFGQSYISKMCIPMKYANTMLPCVPPKHPEGGHEIEDQGHGPPQEDGAAGAGAGAGDAEGEHHRRLLSYERRFLGGGGGGNACKMVIKHTLPNQYSCNHVAFLYFKFVLFRINYSM